jgi:hypothetical protein
MTAERIKEIQQMLEAWRETDAHDGDAERTGIVAELLAELDVYGGQETLESHEGR